MTANTALPDLAILNNICKKWHLTDVVALPERTFTRLFRARRTLDNFPVMLKFGTDQKSLEREALALESYHGNGAVKLYNVDQNNHALLLELIVPGNDLTPLFPARDDDAIRITIDVIKRLHAAPALENCSLPTLEDWLSGFSRPSAIPASFMKKAKNLADQLLLTTHEIVLLHGDLHHENILRISVGAYVAIDPKGIVGDRAYEVIPFLCNPFPQILNDTCFYERWQRRIHTFGTLLNIPENRLVKWSFVHAVAAWGFALEDHQAPAHYRQLATIFAQAAPSA